MRTNPDLPAISGGGATLIISSLCQQQVNETVLGYVASSLANMSVSELATLTANWLTAFKTLYLACLSPESTVTIVTAADASAGVAPTQSTSPVGAVGTAGVSSLPGTVAAVVSKKTDYKGQHGLGRTYMPAVPNTFVSPLTDPDSLNATGIAAYVALFNALTTTPVNIGARTARLSLLTRPVAPATLVSKAAPITGFLVRSPLGTIRRRRLGVGI